MSDHGNLYVIAAPSGTGKTTLVHALVESTPNITVSVSYTTRPKRPNEIHGLNYYFVDKDEFQRMLSKGDFMEYATIFTNLYGTSKSWVEQTLAQGMDVILEIDWQGNRQIKELFPEAIGIFILPPSLEALRERLVTRNQDHPEVIKTRLADARETVSHANEFEYLVINDSFSQAVSELKMIIQAGRLKEKRQSAKYHRLVEELAGMKTT